MSSGYSKTPLAKKLGIKTGHSIYLYNVPKYYMQLFDELPDDILFIKHLKTSKLDFIHAFFSDEHDLKRNIIKLKQGLKIDGILWVSWPKGSSKIETNINREAVRSIILETGLVDIKVCAVDEDWSGLKFVHRLKDRI